MKSVKTLTGTTDNLPGLQLRILLTDEEDAIVARCQKKLKEESGFVRFCPILINATIHA